MATLKIPGIVSPLPSVGSGSLLAPPVPLSQTMSSLVSGMGGNGATFATANASQMLVPPSVAQFPMTAIYPSNFTTGASVGYPL
jgi:hypothetical protein